MVKPRRPLELTLKITGWRSFSPNPNRLLRLPAAKRILADRLPDQARRSKRDEIDQAHGNRRRHLRDRVRQPHPGSLHGAEPRGNGQSGQDQQRCDRPSDQEQCRPVAPKQYRGQHRESRSDGKAEAPTLSRSQSGSMVSRQCSSSCHSGCLSFSRKNGHATSISISVLMKHV